MNDQMLPCGHPVQATSEMLPDFFGDTPKTQRVGTVHCRWCEDIARLEQRIKELEEALRSLLLIFQTAQGKAIIAAERVLLCEEER